MAVAPSFHPALLVEAVGVSEILQWGRKAESLRAAGRDVIVLCAGEPDFDTPDSVRQAAIRAIHAGRTKYTTLDGSAELKDAIRAKFLRDDGRRFGSDPISVASGAKQVLYTALVATLDPGDEVIVPAPVAPDLADQILTVNGGSELLGRRTPGGAILDGDRAIAGYLLDSVGVAVVAGSAFGLAPYFRVSHATSPAQLADACERIARTCRELH